MTLYHFPMLPVENRYPEEWWVQFRREYEQAGIKYEYVVPTEDWPVPFPRGGTGMFTPIIESSVWELQQAQNFVDTFLNKLTPEDTVFFTDIDYPGFSLPLTHIIRLRCPEVGIYGYLHAGSYCNRDIFSTVAGKLHTEIGMIQSYDGVFVGSDYHLDKIGDSMSIHGPDGNNIHVVPPPFYMSQLGDVKPLPYPKRKYDVAYTARIDTQKRIGALIKLAVKNPDVDFVVTNASPRIGKLPKNIYKVPAPDRKQYYSILANSLTFLSTAEEETFGYCAVEAMALGVIPVLPNKLSYPELVRGCGGRTFLYSSIEEASEEIRKAVVYTAQREEPEKYDLGIYEQSIGKMTKIMLGGE